ncbi:MAG: F0F1 ATP synthase subunit epsilon [Rhodospirillaceae bacterium]|nr:F0F1 ATP synthase subunit epsilon [Rhodospirillaceae bacterium]
MADTLKLELVSPERLLLSAQVEMVLVPGAEGVFGVLPRHAPTLSTLRPGFVDVYQGSAVKERFFVTGGFAEVTPSTCTVLVDEAIPQAALTAAFAAERVAWAKSQIEQAAGDDDRRKAQDALGAAEMMAEASAGLH